MYREKGINNMNLFRYTVEFFNEDNKEIEIGIIFAKDFINATENIVKYYGEDLNDILHLRCIADSDIVPLSDKAENILDEVEKNWIW